MDVLMLNEAELRRCAVMNDLSLVAIEDAFSWLHAGRVSMPPIMHVGIPDHNGDVDIKSAYVRGLDEFAVKIASGFYGNSALGLPSSSAMVVVLSAKTGFCKAILLDNGYLTDLRTGLAGAVAAKHLAPSNVDTVGVIGSGIQARYQVQCLALVREFRRVLVHGRNPDHVAACVADLEAATGVPVFAAADAAQLVAQSQVVITTTASTTPVVMADWLHPGLHITAMGSDLPGKQELEANVLARADRLVCDSLSQCAAMGELQHAEAGSVSVKRAQELGSITAGGAGRGSPDEITVCDLTGAGVQDTAIASLALSQARAQGLGVTIAN